ncbi:MAG: UPF0182 family protein [Dehalococcoidia bacterium]|nr:UPF0182 family protein [Dehalococcoidia bacterium]
MSVRENGGIPPFAGWEGVTALPGQLGRWLKLVLAIGFVALLLVGLNVLRSIFTDWLWFDNVGFLSVFTKILWTRVWLFLAGAGLFGVLLSVNVIVARRHARGESVLPLPAEFLRWLDRILVVGIIVGSLLASIVIGSTVSGKWELLLRLVSTTPFGPTLDPVFGKDISFFVFTLPVLEMIQGWFLTVFVVLMAATGLVYVVHSSLRGVPFVVTPWIRNHVAVLGSLTFFDLAFRHFLNRYDLLFSETGAVVGATYADVHARLPAQLFLTAVAVAAGVLLLVTLLPALRGPRGNRLIVGAVALWVGSFVLVGNLYPSFVQRFTVNPSELEKEKPYIARNIEFTRAAFGLDRVEPRRYSARTEVSVDDIQANRATINNVRLWDPAPLMDVYNQIQHLRLYYNFKDVDVDRYTVNGDYRQVLIGARELYPQNLPPEAQRWVNQRLQYTHGYGAAASPVTEFTGDGKPVFFVQDVPPKGPIPITRPEIYFGENTGNYVIVNSLQAEFDRPTVEDLPVYVKYAGEGGVKLSSTLRRLAYAWQFADINILISGQITPESRVQYYRDIQDRIRKIAPFLVLDHDPYMVVEEGRMVWIQDAYTVTNRYPYSRPFNNSFNYIRNSVKVTIDAYQGTMEFYVADTEDPIVRVYETIFPGLFKPLEQMSPLLRAHLRYPEDLFTVQAETYLQYHMTDPTVFFNKEDQWSVPQEIFLNKQQRVEPYYVIMKLPGEDRVEFVLILPFTPAQKPNMVAWLAARMDGNDYGKLVLFEFPRGVQLDGPSQVEARIDNDTFISQQFTLWSQAGSKVIRGNLLVIPIGESILYVEPIFLEAQDLALPELKRVILASSKKVVMEPTLEGALAALLGVPSGTVTPPPPSGQPTPGISEAAQRLERIQKALQDLKNGLISLEDAVHALAQLLQEERK